MKYRKVDIEFVQHPTRFYRQLLVRDGVNLVHVGSILCDALGATFEHNFLFHKDNVDYVPEVFLKDGEVDGFVPMKNYTLNDLGETFTFEYDTKSGWEFNCRVYKKVDEIGGSQAGYILDGKGQGIWENNIYSLLMYLEGKIKDDTKESEEEGLHFPWNFPNERYSDFDKYNLEQDKERLSETVDYAVFKYLDRCHKLGYELEVEQLS